MTAKTTATRAEAIAAAIDKFSGAEFLPDWAGGGAESDYMHGMCAVIADTFGTDDAENARSEVWEEMRIMFEAERLNRRAADYAQKAVGDAHDGLDFPDVLSAVHAAFLAGMEARA
ncbi:hypothetical protein ACI7YT_12530 [Microbacterium sp. M]|uniref:hypothetical protein n=1 Tax=Microbacterium sp. M TaxID=3377125 RepID=UPI0038644E20